MVSDNHLTDKVTSQSASSSLSKRHSVDILTLNSQLLHPPLQLNRFQMLAEGQRRARGLSFRSISHCRRTTVSRSRKSLPQSGQYFVYMNSTELKETPILSYFPLQWGGDCESTYEGMAESLRGGLSLTMSGFAFHSHDIGGFEVSLSLLLSLTGADFLKATLFG